MIAQIGESLLKQACILIIVVCSICPGPILNHGKQGKSQGNISGKTTSLIWQTP